MTDTLSNLILEVRLVDIFERHLILFVNFQGHMHVVFEINGLFHVSLTSATNLTQNFEPFLECFERAEVRLHKAYLEFLMLLAEALLLVDRRLSRLR